MHFNKLRFQNRIENFKVQSQVDFKSFKSSFSIDSSKNFLLESDLLNDSRDFFFNGLLSLVQAISDARKMCYSWATIKAYYSLYYFLRSSLACRGFGICRYEKELFYLENKLGNTFQKIHNGGTLSGTTNNNDHSAVIELSKNILYKLNNIDILQSNTIDSRHPYDWFKDMRDIINYKKQSFLEPKYLDIWENIHDYSRKKTIEKIVNKYLNDSSNIYCFQTEDAILALPIKRFQLTKNDLNINNLTLSLEQMQFLKSTLNMDKSISKHLVGI